MDIADILTTLNANYGTLTALVPDLYYFADEGDNEINDGGDDMYDGANVIATDLFDEDGIPYTHTQFEGGEGGEGDYTSPPMDGVVTDGSDYFGDGSLYFTNMYPGLFVMVVTGAEFGMFKIDGNIGADGGGVASGGDFDLISDDTTYTVYYKLVGETDDPSINHIIIVPKDTNIEHTWDESTDDDLDQIETGDSIETLYYLLTASRVLLEGGEEEWLGERLSVEDVSAIATQFLALLNGAEIREQIHIQPQYTFEVIAYDLADLLSQNLPDTLENTIFARENATVMIGKKQYKHGDQFSAEGLAALYMKKLYVDIEKPVLRIL